jgi:HEAT repeat protein
MCHSRRNVFSGLIFALVVGAASAAQADDVTAWVEMLRTGDAAAKVRAADQLGDLGPEARDAVPALSAALADSDPVVVGHAARALGAIGPDAAAAVEPLIKALSHENPQVRAYAAYALGQLGKASLPAVPALAKAFKDPDATVRRQVFKAVRAIDPGRDVVVPMLVEILTHAQPAEIVPALHTLAEFGDKVVPGAIMALEHPSARYWVCLLLAEIGPDAREAVPALAGVLTDSDVEVRREACIALGHIGSAAGAAVPALIDRLQDEDPIVVSAAAWALGSIGSAASSAIAPLTKLANDDSQQFPQIVAMWTLARLEPTNPQWRARAIPLVAALVEHENPRARRLAVTALADLKADGPEALSALAAALDDQDAELARMAAAALADRGSQAVDVLTEAARDPARRGFAIGALGRIGVDAQAALNTLLAATADPQAAIRAEALLALASVAPRDDRVQAALIKALASDPAGEARAAAALALGAAGVKSQAATGALQKATEDTDHGVAQAAAHALELLQSAAG